MLGGGLQAIWGLVSPIFNINYSPYIWLTLFILTLVIAPFLAFHRIRIERDTLIAKLEERNKNREIADKLAGFATNIERLRDEEAAKIMTVDGYIHSVIPYLNDIRKYLEENCGARFVASFNAVPDIEYGKTPLLTQLNRRLNNLLGIIEYFNQRS